MAAAADSHPVAAHIVPAVVAHIVPAVVARNPAGHRAHLTVEEDCFHYTLLDWGFAPGLDPNS
jgi:hypothetical protein